MTPRPNLATLLEDLALRPSLPALVRRTPFRRFCWTAGETRAAALALSVRLAERGVEPGDRVLLQGPDSPEWAAAFLGIAARGGVVVPLDGGAPPEFLRKVAEKTAASAAVVYAHRTASLEGVVPVIEPIERVSGLRTFRGPFPIPYSARPDETAEIVFTSGTTAEPKGVELSHANLLSTLAGIEAGFRKREPYIRPLLPMRFLCLVPLSHLFGQSLGILVPILMRSTSIFSSTLQPARLLRLVRLEHPLVIVTVPRVLASLRDSLLRELERRGRRQAFERALERSEGRPAWRRILATRDARRVLGWRSWVVVVGGAALDAELEAFWLRCGLAIIQGYGMTEAAPVISIHNPLDGVARTLGRPLGHLEVRLAEDGEVLVRGPNVMKGYYGDPEATREAIQDGWLKTGDLAEQDPEGRLYFKGRKKDIIVLPGGLNVFPSDVEQVLQSLDGVREAVAFASSGQAGEEVHAAVLPGFASLDAEHIRSEANARLLPHQRIRRLVVWEGPDFPRTSTGKVRRREVAATAHILRSLKERGERLPGGPGPSVERVAAALARLRDDLGSHPDPGARLAEDLGLESLEIVELLSLLEEEYDVSVADEEVTSSLTVEGLERMLAKESDRGSLRVPMPRWTQRRPLRILRALLRPLLLRPLYSFFVSLEVHGREHVRPDRGPCLVVANHTSMLDAPTVLFALPRSIRGRLAPAMAIETLPEHFEPEGKPLAQRLRSAILYGLATGLFGSYPLPQSRGFRPSLEYTGELIDRGLCPLIFPEGEMTRIGKLLPFKTGIGLLARETQVPVLPVHLEGLGEILPPDSRWPKKRGRARVTIGEPIEPDADSALDPVALTRRIEDAVRKLASEAKH